MATVENVSVEQRKAHGDSLRPRPKYLLYYINYSVFCSTFAYKVATPGVDSNVQTLLVAKHKWRIRALCFFCNNFQNAWWWWQEKSVE
jgi:hypothetical protein